MNDRLQFTSEGLAWLGAAALLGAVGWWKSTNVVLMLAYFMAALLLLNGLLARIHARRVVVSRESTFPHHAGDDAILPFTVTNVSSHPATVQVEDQCGSEPVCWLVHRLAGGATVVCSAKRIFPTRGRFPAPLRISSGYPLGLLRLERLAAGSDVIILPRMGMIDADGLRRWVLRKGSGEGRSRKVLRRVTTDQADVRGVRPYRPGDPIRSIHWRSSARRSSLMVREYDASPTPDLVLVVEPWLPAAPTAIEKEALEAALSMAATIVHTWSRAYGTRVTVAVAGDPGSVHTTSTADGGIRSALAPLAELKGGTAFAPLGPEAFDRSLSHPARVVVSSRSKSPYATEISAATGRSFVATSPTDQPPWYQFT